MGKADVQNQENVAPGDPALKLCAAASAHERAYPAAALIQSLATSAGGGGGSENFAAPRPRMAAVGAPIPGAPPTTPTRSARALAPLGSSNFNSGNGVAVATTPTKQQAAQCCNGIGEPLTPTSNLKVLVAASAAATACEQLVAASSGGCTTPKKAPCSGGVEPLTPTTNLKVLISAASPDMRNLMSRQREPEQEQLIPSSAPAKAQQLQPAQRRSAVSSDDDYDYVEDYSDDDAIEPDRKKSKKEYVCRKDKSLGLLCQKFISRFEEYPPHNAHIDVSLDELAKELGVERRRIYDIVNVLESVEMMSRRAKNRYLWHGKTRLEETLVKLKQLAEAEGMQQQLNIVREYELSRMSAEEPAAGTTSSAGHNLGVDHNSQSPSGVSLKQYMELFGNQMKKEKSLGIMSQKFLMLFLTSTKTINLDIAAKILIGDPTMDSSANNAKFKTKIRRLYDIANILTSLHLIRKVHVTEVRGRKPAFQYIGPSVELPGTATVAAPIAGVAAPSACGSKQSSAFGEQPGAQPRRSEHGVSSAKRSLIRHASFDTICKVAESERTRLIASQPSSPLTATDDEAGGGPKPARQYVMIQGTGPKMQVITTSQAPNFLAANVPQPPQPQTMQRLTLIPVSSSALPTSAGHVVLRTAVVNDMTRMCHFSPLSGIAPLNTATTGPIISPYMSERSRTETFLVEGNKRLDDACRLLPNFGNHMPTQTLVLRSGCPAPSADVGNGQPDDDFQVYRPMRMMAAAGLCRGNTVLSSSGGQINCQQQLTPMHRGIARGRGMSSLLNPARNIGKSIDLAANESFTDASLRTAVTSEYTLAAPSISEVPLTTISPVRPVASFCSPAGGSGHSDGSLKTPVSGSLKTPVNERPPARAALYTTPGFIPFTSPPSMPTAFRPVHSKTPGSSHVYPETVRRLKLK